MDGPSQDSLSTPCSFESQDMEHGPSQGYVPSVEEHSREQGPSQGSAPAAKKTPVPRKRRRVEQIQLIVDSPKKKPAEPPKLPEDSDAPASMEEDGFVEVVGKKRCPPVFINTGSICVFTILDGFSTANLAFTAKTVGKTVKLQFQNMEHYRQATKMLDTANVAYHSFVLKEERPQKLVLRGLPLNVDLDRLRQKLAEVGVAASHVTQLKPGGKPVPLYLVYAGVDSAKRLSELGRLAGCAITVETFRGRAGPNQCFRCQGWG